MTDQLFHVEYPPNEEGRDFVVGDIHGELDQLISTLDHQGFDNTRDRLFSVGDQIDRGPKSLEMIKLACEPWFCPIRGNHEQMMVDAIFTGRFGLWIANGGGWIFQSHRDTWPNLVDAILEWPLVITVHHKSGKLVGICHAEPPVSDWSNIADIENDPLASQIMIWGRSRITLEDMSIVDNIDWVLCGHTPIASPAILGNTVFIDTGGCFEGGQLTVLNLDLFVERGVLKAAEMVA